MTKVSSHVNSFLLFRGIRKTQKWTCVFFIQLISAVHSPWETSPDSLDFKQRMDGKWKKRSRKKSRVITRIMLIVLKHANVETFSISCHLFSSPVLHAFYSFTIFLLFIFHSSLPSLTFFFANITNLFVRSVFDSNGLSYKFIKMDFKFIAI